MKRYKSQFKVNLPHAGGYPGRGMHYITCDVCGRKIRANESIKISDKYNSLNGMVVCPNDADKTNPQSFIKVRQERQIDNPQFIRSEPTDSFQYIYEASQIESGDISDPVTGNAPGAPTDLSAVPESDTQVVIRWRMDKTDIGSSNISGYKIERESPIGDGFSTILANTKSPALIYIDNSVSSGTQYNYRVSAINSYGISSTSNEADTTT